MPLPKELLLQHEVENELLVFANLSVEVTTSDFQGLAFAYAEKIIQKVKAFLEEEGDVNSMEHEFFVGYVDFDGKRIEVDFSIPVGASKQEKDAAFFDALAQVVELNYLAIGGASDSI